MEKSGIYTITCLINSKIYVGKSIDINKRLVDHRRRLIQGKHDNSYLQNAWNKYGEENFKFEVLEYCDIYFLESQEHYWCIILNTNNPCYGYNIQRTNPIQSYRHALETKQKIGYFHRGRPKTEDFKNKISNILKKKHANNELPKMSPLMTMKGKKHTDESKRKISNANKKDAPLSEDIRNKIRRPIYQYTINMEFIKEWASGFHIKDELGYDNSYISKCCKGIKEEAYGYKWRFKQERKK